jgi:uncharacterized membrane protein
MTKKSNGTADNGNSSNLKASQVSRHYQWIYILGWLIIALLAALLTVLGSFLSNTLMPMVDAIAPSAPFVVRLILLLLAAVVFPFLIGMVADTLLKSARGRVQFETLRRMKRRLSDHGGIDLTTQQAAAIVAWPNDNLRTLVIVTGAVKEPSTGKTLVSIYIPDVPNPTSGALRVIDAASLIPLPWTREQVMDYYVSFGALAPDGQQLGEHIIDEITQTN